MLTQNTKTARNLPRKQIMHRTLEKSWYLKSFGVGLSRLHVWENWQSRTLRRFLKILSHHETWEWLPRAAIGNLARLCLQEVSSKLKDRSQLSNFFRGFAIDCLASSSLHARGQRERTSLPCRAQVSVSLRIKLFLSDPSPWKKSPKNKGSTINMGVGGWGTWTYQGKNCPTHPPSLKLLTGPPLSTFPKQNPGGWGIGGCTHKLIYEFIVCKAIFTHKPLHKCKQAAPACHHPSPQYLYNTKHIK